MFRNAQFIAQAQRNALVPMMHIVKNLKKRAAKQEVVWGPPIIPSPETYLIFRTYSTPPDFSEPTEIHSYIWNFWNENQEMYAIYYSNAVIGKHIINCKFTTHPIHESALYEIEITATDYNGNNPYTLKTRIAPRYMSIPPVYK